MNRSGGRDVLLPKLTPATATHTRTHHRLSLGEPHPRFPLHPHRLQVLTPFKPGEAGKVRSDDGEDVDVSADMSAKVTACNPEVLDAKVDNLIALNDLNGTF